jgi:hypothetical protein
MVPQSGGTKEIRAPEGREGRIEWLILAVLQCGSNAAVMYCGSPVSQNCYVAFESPSTNVYFLLELPMNLVPLLIVR